MDIRGLDEKGEGIEKCRLVITIQLWGYKVHTKNIVNNIEIIMYGTGGYRNILGGTL